jgi:hypothetical protein
MKLSLIIPATWAVVAAATQVLACYVTNHNAICVPTGTVVRNDFAYPKPTCTWLTYTTEVIATANWLKDDVIPQTPGKIDGLITVKPCIGTYKTYNSCISAYENWGASQWDVKSDPVAWTEEFGQSCQ